MNMNTSSVVLPVDRHPREAEAVRRGRDSMLDIQDIVQAIEDASEEACLRHLGYTPDTWSTGGSAHNDDRLLAAYSRASDTIEITDGVAYMSFPRSHCATLAEWRKLAAELTARAWEDQEV